MLEHIPIRDIKRLIVHLRDRSGRVIGKICKYVEPPTDDTPSEQQKVKRMLRDIANELSLAGPRPPGYPTSDEEYVVDPKKADDKKDQFDDEQIDKQKDSGEWLFCEVPDGANLFRFGAIRRSDVCSMCVHFELRGRT